MATETTMDQLHREQLGQQIRDLEARLAHDYVDVSKTTVRDCVAQELSRFAQARVLSFIPVLVERAVRPKLRLAGRHVATA
jgi:hypothetical protein